MTFLVERLVELRRHLDHLSNLRQRVPNGAALQSDLSLHNDVLFSLFTVCQLVIDIASELATRRGERFEDYKDAIPSLGGDPRFSAELVKNLEPLAGFRNVVAHDYVALDLDRVVEALDRLQPVGEFLDLVGQSESADRPKP